MKQFVHKKIKIVGKKHPHFGEEATGIAVKNYQKVKEPALLCESTKGSKFCVFDESDIEVIK